MSTYDRIRSKKGAALAIVIMVGLVIIVLSVGLIPLVLASQTTVNNNYTRREDYIQARSSLEYAKASLYDTVINGNSMPSDFYVLRSQEGDYITTSNPTEFTAAQAGSLTVAGTQYLSAAVCDVDTENATSSREGTRYDISVTTLGSKPYTFNTYCIIPNNTLTIIPAAYLNRTAMPLSNFFVVDGGYGDKQLWDYSSTIEVEKEDSYVNGRPKTTYTTKFGDITESLLRKTDADLSVSDYPVILKTEVTPYRLTDDEYNAYITNPAPGGQTAPTRFTDYQSPASNASPLKMLTDDVIAAALTDGSLTYDGTGVHFSQAVFGTVNNADTKLFYNGSTTAPTAPGKYTVTLDFGGSDVYAPRSGIKLGTLSKEKVTPLLDSYYDIDDDSIGSDSCEVIRADDCPYTGITVYYGYSLTETPTDADTEIFWQAESDFKGLPLNETVYIWVCNESNADYNSACARIGSIVTREPKRISAYTYANTIENGKSYIIYERYSEYALSASGEDVSALDLDSIDLDSIVIDLDSVITGDLAEIIWTAEASSYANRGFNLKNWNGKYLYPNNNSLSLRDNGFSNSDNNWWNYSNINVWRNTGNNNKRYFAFSNNRFSLSRDDTIYVYLYELTIVSQPSTPVQPYDRVFPENGTPTIDDGDLISDIDQARALVTSFGEGNATVTSGGDTFKITNIKVNGTDIAAAAALPNTPGTFGIYATAEKTFDVNGENKTVVYSDVYIGEYSVAKKTVTVTYDISPDYDIGSYGTITSAAELTAAATAAGKTEGEILEALTCVKIDGSATLSVPEAVIGSVIYGFSYDSGNTYDWYSAGNAEINGLSLETDYSVGAVIYGTWEYDVNVTPPAEPTVTGACNINSTYGDYSRSALQTFTTADRLTIAPEDFNFDETYEGDAYTDVILTEAPTGISADFISLSYSHTQTGDWIEHTFLEKSSEPYYVKLKLIDGSESNRFYKCTPEGIILNKTYKVVNSSVDEDIYSVTPGTAYAASYIAAPSVYFAGSERTETVSAATVSTTHCIKTNGTNMLIYANLVVFNAGIDDSLGGKVVLRSYNLNFPDKLSDEQLISYTKSVLVYFYQTVRISNGTVFNGACFYEFESGTDICSLNQSDADLAYAGRTVTSLDEDEDSIIIWENNDALKPYFENGTMPEIELDITFATQAQIENIISGETATWTSSGKLKSDTLITDNASLDDNDEISLDNFVICMYADGYSDTYPDTEQFYSANRIMLECGESLTAGTSTKAVESGIRTRYLSLGSTQLIRGNADSSFNVYSLPLNATEMQLAAEMLSLEIDFERDTSVDTFESYSVEKAIYAYSSGTDIFGASEPSKNVNFTTYSTDYVNGYCAATEGKAGQGVIFCDKYIRITNDDNAYNGTKFTDFLAMRPLREDLNEDSRSLRVYFYTSLLYLDINEIRCETYDTDYHVYLYIAPQEAAYNNQKYLDLFFNANYQHNNNNNEVYYSGPVLIYINSDYEKGLKYWDPWGKVTPNYPYYSNGRQISHSYTTSEKLKSTNVCADYVTTGYGSMEHYMFRTDSNSSITSKTLVSTRNESYVYIPNGLYIVEMDEVYSQEVASGNILNEVRCFSLALLAMDPTHYRVTDEALLASYGIQLDDNNDILSTVFLDYDLTNSYGSTTASFGNGTVK